MINKTESGWQLDKKISIPLIGIILAQTLGLGWWASSIESRIKTVELKYDENKTGIDFRYTELKKSTEQVDRDARQVSDRLIRVEEKLNTLLQAVLANAERFPSKEPRR